MSTSLKIAIDIGHQSYGDEGAVSSCGLSEHDFWSGTPLQTLKKELERLGHTLKVFRRQDHGGSVLAECKAINGWGADIALSLHLNSSDSPTCKGGHEIVYHARSTKGKALALSLDAQFDLIEGLADRNIRTPYKGRGDTFLSETVCPAVIVEGVFLSVDSDVALLRERGEDLALAVARGAHAYAHALDSKGGKK